MLLRFAFLLLITLCSPAFAQTLIDVPPESRAALGLETAAVQKAENYSGAAALGVVEAPAGALMTAQTPFSGVVVQTLVVPGQIIKAGQPIAVIRSRDYPMAQAGLAAAKKMRDHRAEIYERAQKLHALGLRSQEQADEAGHDAFEADLFYQAKQARLALFTPGKTPDVFQMISPGDGLVTALNVHSGDTLAANDPVATVLKGDAYWARVQVSSARGARLSIDAPVQVQGMDDPGRIVAVTPTVDPATRSIEVMVALPAGPVFRLGEVVTLSFQTLGPVQAYKVPNRAVVRMDRGDAVFLENGDGFALTPVQVLSRSGGSALVQGRLTAAGRIAVSGVAALKNMALGG